MKHDEHLVSATESAAKQNENAVGLLDDVRAAEDRILDRAALADVITEVIISEPIIRLDSESAPALAEAIANRLIAEYHLCMREDEVTEVVARRGSAT